jgi:crotonobetainyl-CoA:carnitine CoA-transferase CaiB-like acyl-CoA transferase
MTDATLPLAGIRVVDVTQIYLGPCVTQTLADDGADGIKIEPPKIGDRMRWAIPGDPAGEQGPIFCSINRNKRSVVLDMRTEPARQAVRRMIATADVVANNSPAGVMERLGFGYEACAALNPRIIHAVGTRYRLEGPLCRQGRSGRARPGDDRCDEDPQARINDMILEADAPWDRLRLAGSTVPLSDAPIREIRRLSSQLGEHTQGILAELGLDDAGAAP